MNQNNFLTKQNIIISSIIIIILFYFSYHNFYSNKKIENLEEKTKYEKPRITSKDIDKYIQKEFSKVIKIFSNAIRANPDSSDIEISKMYHYRSKTKYLIEDLEGVLEDCDKAIDILSYKNIALWDNSPKNLGKIEFLAVLDLLS